LELKEVIDWHKLSILVDLLAWIPAMIIYGLLAKEAIDFCCLKGLWDLEFWEPIRVGLKMVYIFFHKYFLKPLQIRLSI